VIARHKTLAMSLNDRLMRNPQALAFMAFLRGPALNCRLGTIERQRA
jgi:hypothetical protein